MRCGIRLGGLGHRCGVGSFAAIVALIVCVLGVQESPAAEATVVLPPVAESRFGPQAPEGWVMGEGWTLSPAGAAAAESCQAAWSLELPESCLVEMIFDLPAPGALEGGVSASLTVAEEDGATGAITGQLRYAEDEYRTMISGVGAEGKRVSASAKGKPRLSALRALGAGETDEVGWAGQTVSLGMMLGRGRCQLLVNGRRSGEIACAVPQQRRVSLACKGIVLKAVRVVPGLAERFVPLSGAGLAMQNECASHEPVEGIVTAPRHSAVLEVGGVPFVVQGAGEGLLTAMDVAVETWPAGSRSEGSSIALADLPRNSYSAAHLLVHVGADGADRTPAMGTGLRLVDANGGDLRNVYVGHVPVRSSDEGVTVEAVPELGRGWFAARVPVNPPALYGRGGKLCLTRPWQNGAVPRPAGKPSALRVAAVTMEKAGIELLVEGNGLGNVYGEPDTPQLSATVRNVTSAPLQVAVRLELVPFERMGVDREMELELEPGEDRTIDALAAPIQERGHYRVRVVADAGAAGRVDYRTNVALLAPDTRKKQESPFGIWPRLSGDNATAEQRQYLWEKAGIGYVHSKHTYTHRLFGGRGHKRVVDEATAEEIALKMGPEVKVAMFGWERKWEDKGAYDVTYSFPRVISEGRPEELSDEVAAKIDGVADELRRFARAVRKLRPEIKISLGNTGVNWVTFLLERGIRPGEHFDYFGTEEGLFSAAPEEPADAVGNINWWARAICEHYGHKDVPLFHSESVYFSSGVGFSRLSERDQAGYYVRTFLLGFPYDSVFGMSGALVDSSNEYVRSLWGTSGYCNQAPECSPKLSYVVYATMTQHLDGMKYDDKLDTGTTSLYALRFRHGDGTPLCVLWNLRGERMVRVRLAAQGKAEVFDALNRPAEVTAVGDSVDLKLSDLPTYVRGVEVQAVERGANVPTELPQRRLLKALASLDDWTVDAEPDEEFERPLPWRGMPRVKGNFDVSAEPDLAPPGEAETAGAIRFRQRPLPGSHGLIPRYVSLRARPGKEVPIPAGTTRLGVWVRGNSTWARVYLGGTGPGGRRFVPSFNKGDNFEGLRFLLKGDNFDGWRFLQTGWLSPEVQDGGFRIDRIVVTMPEQQVYVDDLVTTPRPEIAIGGIYAATETPPPVNYLPW